MGAKRGVWAERLKRCFGFAFVLIALAGGQAAAAPLDASACRKAKAAAFSEGLAIAPRSMTIVAVGSSSTEGIARNARDKIYPAALEQALSRVWPNVAVTVANRGKGGETMRQTLQRFENDVLALKPSLVIWQLGVNDVLRYRGIEGRREEIREGLKVLAERGVPVVLLDLQYAPAVTGDPDAMPMQALIDEAVREGPGRVHHFRRFAVMKDLAEAHHVAKDAMTEADDLHMTDAMHVCVGELLAEMIAARPLVASTTR
jgi:lysophospholipase L1-like esterase